MAEDITLKHLIHITTMFLMQELGPTPKGILPQVVITHNLCMVDLCLHSLCLVDILP